MGNPRFLDTPTDYEEYEEEEEFVCGICYEQIGVGNRTAAIFPNCDHCYCFECIQKWRKSKDADKDVVFACPECRTKSGFVIPHTRFLNGSSKKEFVDNYVERKSRIPCKNYNRGYGKCHFGSKCLYSHERADGTDGKIIQRKREEEQKRKREKEERLQEIHRIELIELHGKYSLSFFIIKKV